MKSPRIFFLLIVAFVNAGETISLNGTWTVTMENFDKKFVGTVPGGIYTDLVNANLIPDCFKGTNDVHHRWIGNRTVSYSRNFSVDNSILEAPRILLIFDGLDTFATIYVNNYEIGQTSNMFLRYVFDVKDYLEAGTNSINVTFSSAVKIAKMLYEKQSGSYTVPPKCVPKTYNGECHVNHIRKMQASFSWDWGPAFPSMGIWKKVELLPVNDALIIESTVDVIDRNENWLINATIVRAIESRRLNHSTSGRLTMKLKIDDMRQLEVSKIISLSSNDNYVTDSVTLNVPKAAVEIWWPNGFGNQKLYDVSIALETRNDRAERVKRIGFRKVELVQDDIPQGRTFYFRINDVAIFAKGSNWIPSSVFPELSSQEKVIRHLLSSAMEAHMNMLRVWGGGLYESDLFYELADEYGIMIWQDFMFACSMYPTNSEFLESVREEVRQNVKRLKHHPSIIIWAGNNENEAALHDNWYGTGSAPVYKQDYLKLYVDLIKREVEALDVSRPFVVSSPSDGSWADENGFIGPNPYSNLYGDVHYYNYLRNSWNINQYPIARFVSEYGFQSIPSMETLMTATTELDDLKLDSEFLKNRQHLPAGWSFMKLLISKNFDIPRSNDSYRDLQNFIYLSQVNQAVSVRIETESYRQMRNSLNELGEGYTMGALYWQLNDVWQAPSWSSIEFGGNWKLLHYYAIDFFAPIIVSPRVSEANDVTIYIVSDEMLSISGCQIDINVYKWSSPQIRYTKNFTNITVVANAAQEIGTFWLNKLLEEASCGSGMSAAKNCIVELVLLDKMKHRIAPINYVYPAPLNDVILPKSAIRVIIHETIPGKLSNYLDYIIELMAGNIQLFVWVELPHNLGRFSENGFHLIGSKRIIFHASTALTAQELYDDLQITTLSQLYD